MKTSLLFSEKQIEAQVAELAKQINLKYGTEEVIAVGILKGCFVFFSDLIKHLTTSTICDFCSVSFYGQSIRAKQTASLSLNMSQPIQDKHILLIDCIADHGYSLKHMQDHILRHKPKSLTSVVLISKPEAHKTASIDFSGFRVDQDVFVVGYGIDYKEEGRSLPYLAQLEDLN
ncbi:MAG: hypoxanthine phosphoribosyltransferase [Bdellovibrionales bacterium]|nr:hypoxanthine phosphoribosyltransferase [Bdellovibrionales bacterium]